MRCPVAGAARKAARRAVRRPAPLEAGFAAVRTTPDGWPREAAAGFRLRTEAAAFAYQRGWPDFAVVAWIDTADTDLPATTPRPSPAPAPGRSPGWLAPRPSTP